MSNYSPDARSRKLSTKMSNRDLIQMPNPVEALILIHNTSKKKKLKAISNKHISRNSAKTLKTDFLAKTQTKAQTQTHLVSEHLPIHQFLLYSLISK